MTAAISHSPSLTCIRLVSKRNAVIPAAQSCLPGYIPEFKEKRRCSPVAKRPLELASIETWAPWLRKVQGGANASPGKNLTTMAALTGHPIYQGALTRQTFYSRCSREDLFYRAEALRRQRI